MKPPERLAGYREADRFGAGRRREATRSEWSLGKAPL